MKGIKFNTKEEAQAYNNQEALDRGCSGVTKYWYDMKELTEESSIAKDEYANIVGISKKIVKDPDGLVDNPKYVKLPSTVKVKKHAIIVGDDKNEDENVTVEDVSSLIVTEE